MNLSVIYLFQNIIWKKKWAVTSYLWHANFMGAFSLALVSGLQWYVILYQWQASCLPDADCPNKLVSCHCLCHCWPRWWLRHSSSQQSFLLVCVLHSAQCIRGLRQRVDAWKVWKRVSFWVWKFEREWVFERHAPVWVFEPEKLRRRQWVFS